MTVEEIRKKLPARFTRGVGLAGPDYFGCCNTGMRPCIVYAPYKQVSGYFMVGPEIPIDQHKFQIASDRLGGRNKYQYGEGNRAVFVFKTRDNAIAKFLELCQGVLTWNEQQRQEAQAARERLRKNPTDVEAALTLGDLGVL